MLALHASRFGRQDGAMAARCGRCWSEKGERLLEFEEVLADGAKVLSKAKNPNRKTSERYGATSALLQHGHDTLHAAWAFCSKPHAAYSAHAARRPVKAQP